MRFRHRPWFCLLPALLAGACGLLGDKGHEPKGDQDLPVSGVGKFQKQDYYCQTEFVQPFFVLDPAPPPGPPPAPPSPLSGEPCALADGGSIRVWYEIRESDSQGVTTSSKIVTALLSLGVGTDCRQADAGLVEGSLQDIVFKIREGENEIVLSPQPLAGGPAVVKVAGLYRMWFQIGDSEAVGYAETRNCTDQDCTSWFLVRDNAAAVRDRVLEPNQLWEAGTVGSPSVVLFNGLYRMWYDGDVAGSRAIGHAWSANGLDWVKSDAAGEHAPALGGANGPVQPVLVATQTNWEFWYPDPAGPRHQGRVGTPCVIVHPTPARVLLLLYYTGNLRDRLQVPTRRVDPDNPGLHMDASIGLAASEDGLNWEKAPSFSEPEVIANEINPIVAEKLPISIDPDRPAGSVNVFNPAFIVNEAEPAVLEVIPNQFFIMFWHQIDYANLYVTPLTPKDNGFPGGSGLGFAFTGNLPF